MRAPCVGIPRRIKTLAEGRHVNGQLDRPPHLSSGPANFQV